MEVITRTDSHRVDAEMKNGSLWLTKSDFERVTGFALRPEGFCRDDECIPVPESREKDFVNKDLISLSAFARLTTRPLVCDEAQQHCFLDDAIEARNEQLLACKAPDFELPDMDGKPHRLSDYFGKKILLASWASW